MRKKLCLALVLPLVLVVFAAGASSPAQATPDHYNPPKGATFNNPYGGSSRRTGSAPADPHHQQREEGSQDPDRVVELPQPVHRQRADRAPTSAASACGVIMDYGNWNPDIPNAIARRTQGGASRATSTASADMTSWLRRCHGSCRGHHGIAHTKFYTFDKVDHTRNVVMYGSANATQLAATIQWNDIYTMTRSRSKYNEFIRSSTRCSTSEAVRQGYLHYNARPHELGFYPYTGKGTTSGTRC